MCVCGSRGGGGGVGRDTNYLSRCVQDGKLLMTRVEKDWSISPTAQITHKRSESREFTRGVNCGG